MSVENEERRRFPRQSVTEGMVFVDHQNGCGSGKVVNISRGGVKCVTLGEIGCPINWMDGIELYDQVRDIVLTGLSARMVHCSDNCIEPQFFPVRHCYVFGVEFAEQHRIYLERLLTH